VAQCTGTFDALAQEAAGTLLIVQCSVDVSEIMSKEKERTPT
jgi:hypothetical protein